MTLRAIPVSPGPSVFEHAFLTRCCLFERIRLLAPFRVARTSARKASMAPPPPPPMAPLDDSSHVVVVDEATHQTTQLFFRGSGWMWLGGL